MQDLKEVFEFAVHRYQAHAMAAEAAAAAAIEQRDRAIRERDEARAALDRIKRIARAMKRKSVKIEHLSSITGAE